MNSWNSRDARARFSEFLDAALKKGPQVVTRRGVDLAVLVSIEDWKRLQGETRPNIKELLLGPGPRFENVAPNRGRMVAASVIDFERWHTFILQHHRERR